MKRAEHTQPFPGALIYEVEFGTMLGIRRGLLDLHLTGEKLSGALKLMNAENAVVGRVTPNGTCSLSGSIQSRMNAYPFEGEGVVSPERVDLMLRCAGDALPLRGARKED